MAMANNGGDWNSFMQSKQMQTILYSICVFFCLFYAVGGIMDLMHPERSAALIANMGETGFYAMTIIRTVVLLITGVAFARIVYKRAKSGDEE